ncbi:diguanylate cyclase domain-containing protein [Planktothrix paucivesiculata]|nr:diguanylate cyclase [Planktothrix paucivesiculata]
MTLTQQIHQNLELGEILNVMVKGIRAILGCDRAVVYRFLPDGDGVVAEESVSPEATPILGQLIYDPCFQAKWVDRYRHGQISSIEDVETRPLQACYKELLQRLQIAANLVVPILLPRSPSPQTSPTLPDLWGLLIVHQCQSSRHWTTLDIKFMQQMAMQLGIAIQYREADHHLRQLYQQKPQGISLPIQEINATHDCQCSDLGNEYLTEKSNNAISITELNGLDRLQTPIWIFDIENLQMWWANRAALHIWNATDREELIQRNFHDISEATRIRLNAYLQQFKYKKNITETWTFYPESKPMSVRCNCSEIQIETGRMAMLVEGITEVANQSSPETLRAIEVLNHTTVMISLYTLEGVPLMQNPSALECYGDTLHPNLNNDNAFVRHFVDPKIGETAIVTAQSGAIFSIETQVYTLNGIRWHGLDVRCTRDPVTGNAMLLVNEKDITEKQSALIQYLHTEQELRWKEALLRSMTDTSNLAFFVVDNRTDNILYFNHRFCEIWQIEHLEIKMLEGVLKNNDIIPDCIPLIADVPAFAESCKPLQSEENRMVIEDAIAFSDGRTIRRFSSQIRDQDDHYFGRLYIFEDISDRQQVEINLKESEERYRSVIAAMGEGIVLQQADGQITACNQSAEKILGLTIHQMTGLTSIDARWRAIQNDGSPFPGENHPAMVTLRTGKPEFDVTMGVHKPDGTLTWISINSQPLFHADRPQAYAVVASFSDITVRKQAEETLKQQAERERMIYGITQRIRQSLDLDEILQTTVAEVRQFLQTDRVIIYRFNPDWSGVVVKESVSAGTKSVLNQKITDSYFVENQGKSYEQNTLKQTSDIYNAEINPCHLELLEKLQVRAILVVPILQSPGLWGLLVAHHCTGPREWHPLETELLKQLAIQLAIAIHQSELHQQLQLANQQLQNLAMVDQLTQIANRRCFDEILNQEWNRLIREQRPLSLLLSDIDYFKQYNDTYGHSQGDICLQQVAQALQQGVQRSVDLVARYGGEEFVVILPHTDQEGALQVAQKIQDVLERFNLPHRSSNVADRVTMSIGICTLIPTVERFPLDLINGADHALYQAKTQGRNRAVSSIL